MVVKSTFLKSYGPIISFGRRNRESATELELNTRVSNFRISRIRVLAGYEFVNFYVSIKILYFSCTYMYCVLC